MLANRSQSQILRTRRSVHQALGLVFVLLVIGTTGYVLIENWSISDALYMTLLTISTVGFQEVHPLTPHGRLFTGVLIVGGVGVAAYSLTTAARGIVEGELKRFRGMKRMEKRLNHLSHHTIICGYGRLSRIVVEEMLRAGVNVAVIETSPERVRELETLGIPFVEGSAYEDDVLRAAGVERAANLLSLLPANADNVYVTLCARDLNPNLNIVARAEDESGESKLRRAGAHEVFAPYRLGGHRIVQRILRPHVSNFLELATNSKESQLALEQVVVPENSILAGKTLEESGLRDKTGVIVAAVIDSSGEMKFNPDRETKLVSGCTMIVFGDTKALEKLTSLVGDGARA